MSSLTLPKSLDMENQPLTSTVDAESGHGDGHTPETKIRASLPKWLLISSIVAGFMMLIVLIAFTTTLYVRTDQLQAYYEKIILDETPESRSRNKRSAVQNQILSGTPDETDRHKSTGKTEKHQISKFGKTNEGLKIRESAAVYLTGNTKYQTLVKENGVHVIDNWAVNLLDDSKFNLENNAFVEVREAGTYLIYAQLSWRKRDGLASFSVRNTRDEEESLATCVTHFSDKYAQLESCYTSVSVELKSGDKIYVAVQNDNLTLDFMKGRAFFGIILLKGIDGERENSSLS